MDASRWLKTLTWTGFALVPFLAQPAIAQPTVPRPLPTAVTAEPGRRVVAFIYGNVPVYRDELGDYLIARGGMEKVELLVNRRMIEVASARAGVSVTPAEIKAGLEDDLRGANVDVAAFIQVIRERYGKSIFEWEQDVIRPRLQLGKMSRAKITLAAEEMQKAFESRYGEKREAQLIVWPKAGVQQLTQAEKDTARSSAAEFNKMAANQPDPGLAKAHGLVTPVGRHIDGEDPKVENALFTTKEGEISEWIETKTTWNCIRCVRIIPPADPTLTLDKVKGEVEKDLFDRKITAAIPDTFARIKLEATPKLTMQVPKPAAIDPANPPERVANPDPRVLATVYGTIAITREDLGDFLIVRGGFEKLELLVNKRIIELEASKRGVTVTPAELEVAKKEYVDKLGIDNVTIEDFVKHVLPKRNLTALSWVEDIIKPELVLTKMCRDRVKVTPEELQRAFETKFGEKRAAKIILWQKDEFRIAQKQWDEARQSDAEFDRIARSQFNRELASAAGKVADVGRYPDADNTLIADTVFKLKEGEVSQLFQTPAGIICVKNVGTVPATIGVTLEKVRKDLEKDVFERKLSRELGVMFAEMKAVANPYLVLRGPTSSKEFEEGNKQLIQQAVGSVPK